MNEVIRTIKSRRSVRSYKPDALTRQQVDAILEAGIWAPTGHNSQPWHFTVIQDRTVLDDINARAKGKMAGTNVDWIRSISADPNADITHKAPALIIVSLRQDAVMGNTDCVAAMQNMLVAAQSLGIGSCWMGLVGFLFGDEEAMRGFGVPEGYKAVQAAVFGYPADDTKMDVPVRNRDVVNYVGKFE